MPTGRNSTAWAGRPATPGFQTTSWRIASSSLGSRTRQRGTGFALGPNAAPWNGPRWPRRPTKPR
eukprot:6237621-Lingulodinium_polyedra.AAC.1